MARSDLFLVIVSGLIACLAAPLYAGQNSTTRVPANASVLGNEWDCDLGFRKTGEICAKMTPNEALAQLQRLAIMQATSSNQNLEGQEFSLRDVDRRCEAYKYSERYGELECSGSQLRILERRCEVYFYDSQNGEIECRGSFLRPVERRCSVTLYSDRYGDVFCR